MELFNVTINSALDVSLLLTILAIVCYYFGHIISSAKPQKDERTATYVEGFLFIVAYIVFPFIVLYTILHIRSTNLSWWLLILIPQYGWVKILHTKWRALDAGKLQLERLLKNAIKAKTQSVVQGTPLKKFKVLLKGSKEIYSYLSS